MIGGKRVFEILIGFQIHRLGIVAAHCCRRIDDEVMILELTNVVEEEWADDD